MSPAMLFLEGGWVHPPPVFVCVLPPPAAFHHPENACVAKKGGGEIPPLLILLAPTCVHLSLSLPPPPGAPDLKKREPRMFVRPIFAFVFRAN